MYGPRIFLVFFSLVLISGCATTSESPQLIPPPGTRIEVTQELSTGGGARLFIQYGAIKQRRDITVVEPYCQFVSTRPRSEFSESLVIQPEVFTVKRSYRRVDFAWAAGVEVAEIDSNRDMSTIMELSSDIQPGIDRLTCLRWGSRWLDGYLTIEEMRGALGGLVQINLPGDQ
jgi:hypothetical protein